MSHILDRLQGGDRRSIGRSTEVVRAIMDDPALFPEVFEGMFSSDPIIRMRAADVIEKVSRKHPEYLQPFKSRLLSDVALVPQQEVRWHLARMFPHLNLTPEERERVISLLFTWVGSKDRSMIVKVNSLQSLAEFAQEDARLRITLVNTLQEVIQSGSPAMKARSRKLLKGLAAGSG
jgi:hypothetical protein